MILTSEGPGEGVKHLTQGLAFVGAEKILPPHHIPAVFENSHNSISCFCPCSVVGGFSELTLCKASLCCTFLDPPLSDGPLIGPGHLASSKARGGGSGGQEEGAAGTSLSGTLPAQTQMCLEQMGSNRRAPQFEAFLF